MSLRNKATFFSPSNSTKSEKMSSYERNAKKQKIEALASSEWECLSQDILATIFMKVTPVDEMLRAVPFVCKAWCDVVRGPLCWSDVDIEQWCRRVNCIRKIDVAIRCLVRRSAGCLKMLTAYKISKDGFAFAAASTNFLKVLKIPMSEVSDRTVSARIKSLHLITTLDISHCLQITYKGIELIGKNCKFLTYLRRNIPPPQPDFMSSDNGAASKVDESEALALANTMPSIEHLELAYGLFSDIGLDAVMARCPNLKTLDIRGCWNVKLRRHIEVKCYMLPCFKDPWYDQFDYGYSDDDQADSDDDDDDDDGHDNDADVVIISSDDDDYQTVDVLKDSKKSEISWRLQRESNR